MYCVPGCPERSRSRSWRSCRFDWRSIAEAMLAYERVLAILNTLLLVAAFDIAVMPMGNKVLSMFPRLSLLTFYIWWFFAPLVLTSHCTSKGLQTCRRYVFTHFMFLFSLFFCCCCLLDFLSSVACICGYFYSRYRVSRTVLLTQARMIG